MIVREYLEKINKPFENITFIKARARKDANTPFHHFEYQTTPIYTVEELIKNNVPILDYIILNDNQPPIQWIDGNWMNSFKNEQLICMLVVNDEDFNLIHGNDNFSKQIINSIGNKICKKL